MSPGSFKEDSLPCWKFQAGIQSLPNANGKGDSVLHCGIKWDPGPHYRAKEDPVPHGNSGGKNRRIKCYTPNGIQRYIHTYKGIRITSVALTGFLSDKGLF